MKTVFFGADRFVLPLLQALHAHYDIPLVLTTEKNASEPISTFAKEHNLSLIAVEKFTPEIIEKVKKADVEVAVLAYFGMILPNSILSLFPKGIINVHPSLLPKFRGPTPVQSAMLAGETETGVSIIRLDDDVDHGPILAQEKAPILPDDTDETLHKRLFEKGAEMLIESLPKYVSGQLKPTEQDHAKASFTQRLTRDSGFFDSSNPPTKEKLQLMIKSLYPWPGVWTTTELKGEQKRVKFLPEGKLHVQDKKPMFVKDFLNGYPEKQEWLKKLGF